jgi:hypothetical protein
MRLVRQSCALESWRSWRSKLVPESQGQALYWVRASRTRACITAQDVLWVKGFFIVVARERSEGGESENDGDFGTLLA